MEEGLDLIMDKKKKKKEKKAKGEKEEILDDLETKTVTTVASSAKTEEEMDLAKQLFGDMDLSYCPEEMDFPVYTSFAAIKKNKPVSYKDMAVRDEMFCECEEPPKYGQENMLDRIVALLQKDSQGGNKKIDVKKPKFASKTGNKVLMCVNFDEVCASFGRDPDHVRTQILAELNLEGELVKRESGTIEFHIKGNIREDVFNKHIKSQMTNFVRCNSCTSYNTAICKQKDGNQLVCNACKADYYLNEIKKGYHAMARGERRTIRNNTVV